MRSVTTLKPGEGMVLPDGRLVLRGITGMLLVFGEEGPEGPMAVDLAMKRVDGEALRIDMAGLVPATISVKYPKTGKVFKRKVMVRRSQAKQLEKAGVQSSQGAKVTPAVAKVFEELSKVPREQRPKSWQSAVKTLVDARHGGRLGPPFG